MDPTDVADNVQAKVESSTDADDNNSLKENQIINTNMNQNRRGRGGFRGGRRQPSGAQEKFKNSRARGKQSYDNQSHEDRASMDGRMNRNHPRGPDEKFNERAAQLSGSTYDLPPVDTSERKFNGRNRLYIGNIGAEITEKDIGDLFAKYGECAETFINKEKNFGFIKLDYHCNAEKAKKELDGTVLKSRNLKIRFAPNSAAIKIKNLTPFVSNELLLYAFSIFGEIEKAVVCVDERGRPTGEGIIDFSRRGSALAALRKCADSCFFLTTSLRPCIVEIYETADNIDGFSEKSINRKSLEYQNERERGPRFAGRGSFEEEYGTRWKKLFDLHYQKEEALKKELNLEIEKLSAQMEYARYEHETEILRNRLKERELAKEKQKREWEMRERMVEQERLRTEEIMRKSQEEMDSWARRQQEESNRRQDEKDLFLQAQSLDSMLEYQESGYAAANHGFQEEPSVATMFLSSYERPTMSRFPAENGGVWVTDSRQKRRKH